MTGARFRYDPLLPPAYPVGEGPFRARGLAYDAALRYVEQRVQGGREAFLAALGPNDPFASFYGQIFLVGGEYDLSPLVRLYRVVADLERVEIGRLIAERSRKSAESDTQGVWRRMLRGSSPEEMAERLNFAFNRYFPPCHAERIAVRPGLFECQLEGLPKCMAGIHVSSTTGFVTAALGIAGAPDARIAWEAPLPDGERGGQPTERVRFVATWTPQG